MQEASPTFKNRWTLRKIFSMLLALAMVVSLLPVPAYAAFSAEEGQWEQTFQPHDLMMRGKMAAVIDSENNSVPVFAGGEGTAESPYQIATAEQLDQVRNYLDKNYILTVDIDLAGYENWEPIGAFQPLSDKPEDAEKPKREVAFTGNFDGNGHTIANVTINRPEGMAVGLFGCVAGEEDNPSSIYDLTVKNVDVTGSFLVGGVVGLQFLCNLEDVSLTGSNTVRGYQGAGGITGVSFGDLSGCDAVADIVLLGDGGGCAGVLAGGQEGVSLIDCTATGTVTAEGDKCFGLGGLAGAANDGVAVTNCQADVSITALGKENIAVGGLLGYTGTRSEDTPTLVTGCSADTTITVSDSTTQVGGLVGGNFYPEFYAYVISDCDTSGNITGGSEAVGSIAGYAHNSEVKNCTSTMTINGESENVPQVGKVETGISPFAGGSGTESDPYQIATAEQLDQMRNYLDKNYILKVDIDLAGYENWEPIGAFQPLGDEGEDAEIPQRAVAFTGTFDGDGHKISNVTINQPEGMAVGLFGCIVGGAGNTVSIDDLTVENADVTGNFCVGGVVGFQYGDSTLENISLTGSNTVRGNTYVAGILGGSDRGGGTPELTDCDAAANIVVVGGFGNSAGVLGGALDGMTVTGCTATGTVTATGDNCFALGGLLGGAFEGVAVTDCHADAVTITVSGANNTMVGGLLGYAGTFGEETPTQVTGCSADATIIVSATTNRVGGLIGGSFYHEWYAEDRPEPGAYAVSGCSTSGSITGGGTEVGSIAGYAYNSKVENCTSTMTINGESENVPQVGKVETGVSPFAGGSGTESDPYQIATAEQLDQMRNYLDKNYILKVDIDLAGYENWEPIGTFQPLSDKAEDAETPNPEVAFTGNFDGNGHTIANVTINKPMAAGLFGCAIGEEDKPISIHDLTVKNVDVTGYFLAGGVVGYQSLNCTLENVNLTGSNTVRSNFAAGGITGATMSDLKNCNATADIVALDDGYCAGVLVGGTSAVSLIDCTATGTVTAEGNNCFGLGGLAGGPATAVEVTNCHAEVSITALGENNLMVGGLLGFTGTYGEDTPTLVTGCSADAIITVSDSTTSVGGLVGGSFYHELYASEKPVPSSYAIRDCTTSGIITGGSEAGSIAGYAYRSTVENCTSTMTINGESENVPQVGKIAIVTPVLIADSIGNIVGKSVDLTFTDDTAWRAAISGITVDGTALTTGQYTVTAGKINIAASVLTTAAAHSIVVKATGYYDAVVTQTMTADSGGGSGGGGSNGGGSNGGGSSGNTDSGTVNPGTVNPGGDNTQYNKTALEALAKATTQQIQNAQLPANAPTVDPADASSVTLTTNDGIQIVVPSGAVSNQQGPVQIAVTIGAIATPPKADPTAVVLDPLRYERQFSIAGQAEGSIQFNSPVMITFPIATADLPSGVTPQQLAIYWWNQDRNDWVKLGGAFDTSTKTISVPTYHFSTYAVMADTSPVPNRIFGADRFATANAVADQGWKAGADNVVLTYAYAFPDALAAVPLAYKLNAPILLTDNTVLTPSTLAEIQKLAPKKITLIGGTAVISQSIQDTLSATYGQDNVVRYAGEDRYSTAVAIAKALGTTGKAVLANGEDGHYTDALAVSGYAAANGIPILFSETTTLPNVTSQALSNLKVKTTVVVGGEGVVPAAVYNQLTGASRYGGVDCYETATKIATGLQLNVNRVYIVTGLDFPDALVAGNLAAHTLSPLLMVDMGVPEATSAFLTANKAEISSLIEIGGEGIINSDQDNALRSDLQ
ncbi:MAG TPA: cell wall-binding repeat-containing protein [Patescibacteria group bacterium]|nr:cell wall-binding repeat-containing protein [Patescibacteria group bacterium]